jgi:hypothetical protein
LYDHTLPPAARPVALTAAASLALSAPVLADSVTGAVSTAPGSPPAVFEMQGGSAVLRGPAFAAGVDVETQPFISRFVGVRGGMSYVARSIYRGSNPPQLGASLQLAAGWSRVEVAVGWIALQNSDAYDSGRMNFDLDIDVALVGHWRLRLQHWSNAASSRPNLGRNIALIDYRF